MIEYIAVQISHIFHEKRKDKLKCEFLHFGAQWDKT